MDSEKREIKGFKCYETDRDFLDSLIALLKNNPVKENLAVDIANIINDYEHKPVNGLIRDVVSDIECHLGIYKNRIRDFEPRNDFDFAIGVKYYTDLLNTIRTSENFILPDNNYKTYIRWLYYENEKIEIEVLYKDNWNFILYKNKHALDFYISIVFSQSFASWDVDFKIEGEYKQRVLTMIINGEISKSIMLEIVEYYKAEYYKNKNNEA